MIFLHLFETETAYTEAREERYIEPWVSLTNENHDVNYNKTEYEKLLETPLTFEVTSAGTINFTQGEDIVIEYRKNAGEWTTMPASINVVSGDTVQFRGENQSYLFGKTEYNFNGTSCGFKLKGNIMSLVYYDDFMDKSVLNGEYTFCNLFFECYGLTNADKLLLPATTLAYGSYQGMFGGCTSLTAVPELPATTLAGSCYEFMFRGCTSLTTPPELPATTLAGNCYDFMFSECVSLTATPKLPVTTLADNCYNGMFSGCISLTIPPELPATIMTRRCYSRMFYGCTSLTTAPELPATTLADYCYDSMFSGCVSLTSAPELSVTTLASGCYSSMFEGCTSLTIPPTLSATTLAYYCYSRMFYGCTSLTTAPELPATTLAEGCYNRMFSGCVLLTTAPVLSAATVVGFSYEEMFKDCSNLNHIKCLATSISGQQTTLNWVSGVAPSGTFVKSSSMSSWPNGAGGIPSNWTVQNA